MKLRRDGSMPRFFFDDILGESRNVINNLDLGDYPNLGTFIDSISSHPDLIHLSKMLGEATHEKQAFFITLFASTWIWKTGRIIYCDQKIKFDGWNQVQAKEIFQDSAVLLLNPPDDLIMANGAKVEGVAVISSPYKRILIEDPHKAADNWVMGEHGDRTILTVTFGRDDQNHLCVSYQFYIAGYQPIGVELETYMDSLQVRYLPAIKELRDQGEEAKAKGYENLIESACKNQIPFKWACEVLCANRINMVTEEQVGKRFKSQKPPSHKKNKSNVKMYFKWGLKPSTFAPVGLGVLQKTV